MFRRSGLGLLAVVLLVGCSGGGSGRSLADTVKAYAEAALHGTASQVNALADCPAVSDAYLTELRANTENVAHAKLSDMHVTGAQTRNETASTGEAEATFDNPALGNFNWLSFEHLNGKWLVTDCSKMPFGGSGQGFSVSNTSSFGTSN